MIQIPPIAPSSDADREIVVRVIADDASSVTGEQVDHDPISRYGGGPGPDQPLHATSDHTDGAGERPTLPIVTDNVVPIPSAGAPASIIHSGQGASRAPIFTVKTDPAVNIGMYELNTQLATYEGTDVPEGLFRDYCKSYILAAQPGSYIATDMDAYIGDFLSNYKQAYQWWPEGVPVSAQMPDLLTFARGCVVIPPAAPMTAMERLNHAAQAAQIWVKAAEPKPKRGKAKEVARATLERKAIARARADHTETRNALYQRYLDLCDRRKRIDARLAARCEQAYLEFKTHRESWATVEQAARATVDNIEFIRDHRSES